MPITFKGTTETEDQFPYPTADEGSPEERTRPHISVLGMLLAFVAAAGLAACITLLYRGTAVIMETAGGFVATGGPYVIAHPAPDWVWLIPVSIFGLIAFAAIDWAAAKRGWGLNLWLFVWMALFISLGWNFLRLGFNPPEGLQGAWAWIMCGVIFWVMGLAPAFLVFKGAREGFQSLVDRQSSDARMVWRVPKKSDTTGVYLAAQALGAVAGIVVGVVLFGRIAS